MISDWSNYYVIRIQSKENRNNFIHDMKNEKDVLIVEKNNKMQSFLIPTDEYFYKQWYLKNDGTSEQGNGTVGADIRATEAWEITTGESDVKVAIVDYGLYSHPEYSSRLTGDATSNESHGTLIAGIIGAEGNSINNRGIAGIAWNSGLINADYGGGTTAEAVASIIRAFNYGAYILNNSWGDPNGYSTILRQVFADAYKLNLISIVAMGNDYLEQVVNYPAAFYQGVISIGATNNNDEVAEFSTIGSWMDVCAPGGTDFPNDVNDIYSTYLSDIYDYDHGTSFSAPIVAGIAALMLSINLPGIILDDDDVENIIKWSAEDKFTPGFDIYYGWGRVDARNALDKLLLPYEIRHYITVGGSIYNSTGFMTYFFNGVDGLINNYPYLVKRHEVRKTVNFTNKPETRVWGRGYLTEGYSVENPNYGLGWTDVVSYSNSSAVLRSYVYEVYGLGQIFLGWYPCEASQVYLNYTTHQKTGVIPPGTTNLTWYDDHPKPYWIASTDPNLDYYEVWKLKDGSWS
ncbi:MAG: S8 family serine peptidase, partial [Candidatus Lokiarchaeota archaeon]|nr:S8 family serine peptidase [Candidatus Lokiarchaeota archaeon]